MRICRRFAGLLDYLSPSLLPGNALAIGSSTWYYYFLFYLVYLDYLAYLAYLL